MVFMKPKLLHILVSLTLIPALASACGPGGLTYSGPTDACGPVEPSQDDVDFVLEFGQAPFNQPDWVKSYTVEPYRVTLTRQNNQENAVAYLEYLMYNCGYGQTELDEYFSEEGFATVFSNYDSYTLYNFCENENKDLALYEYELEDEDEEFAARYWVQQISDTRLLIQMLVFPSNRMPIMNGYAQEIFPELVACGGP
jgi:hypothetical protein